MTWTRRIPLAVSTDGLLLQSWYRTQTLPWTIVDAVRITAVRDWGAVTVLAAAGGLPILPGVVLTCGVRRADLAALDAMLRAYAPARALAGGEN